MMQSSGLHHRDSTDAMAQDSARASHQKKFTPLGIVFTVAGLLLFVYFVRKAGVGQILDGIKKLGFGFVLILAISSIRHIVRSLSWMLCFDGPDRLRFWDALRGRLMGDALGNIVGIANFLVSEPAKPAMIRDRVPLMSGLTAIAIENIFYAFPFFPEWRHCCSPFNCRSLCESPALGRWLQFHSWLRCSIFLSAGNTESLAACSGFCIDGDCRRDRK